MIAKNGVDAKIIREGVELESGAANEANGYMGHMQYFLPRLQLSHGQSCLVACASREAMGRVAYSITIKGVGVCAQLTLALVMPWVCGAFEEKVLPVQGS